MPATFGSVWRTVRLHVPDAPALLVRTWVQDAYAQLTDFRPWLWTFTQGQLVWADARDLAAVVTTFGSPTVTSAALFLAADAGRQFRVGSSPIYTVLRVDSTSSITLDQDYQGTEDGTVEAEIVDAYATLPEAFSNFVSLTDAVQQRLVPWWMTLEELNLQDPNRTSAGIPVCLAAQSLSAYPATLGQVQFAYWPIPTEAGALQYYMRTRPVELADETPFTGVLAHRSDVIETGALASAAKWPGTRERPNPYFNLQLARQLQQDFMDLLQQLDLRDDDQNLQSLDSVPWQRWRGWAWAYPTHLLQMTDATLGAYAGYFGGIYGAYADY